MTLQEVVQFARHYVHRGWSPIIRGLAAIYPPARHYPAHLRNSDVLIVDLSENMCHGYFYTGEIAHERYSEALFNLVLGPGDVFVDVGANIGYFSRLGARRVGKKGRVHSFEPLPSALALLEQNIHGLDNVILHAVAAGNATGTAEFSVNKAGNMSGLGHNPAAKAYIEVQTARLDDELRTAERIDVLKVDVEGHEYQVLQGAVDLLIRHQPLLYFELLDSYAGERDLTFAKYEALLEPLGYRLAWINPAFPAGELTQSEPSEYVLGIPIDGRWSLLGTGPLALL